MIKFIVVSITSLIFAQYQDSVVFAKEDAIVWHPLQQVSGTATGHGGEILTAYHNGRDLPVVVSTDDRFSLDLKLRPGENKIWVISNNGKALSDTLTLNLKYSGYPIVEPIPHVKGDSVILKENLVTNPLNVEMEFIWSASSENPVAVEIFKDGNQNWLKLPSVPGEYFFNLDVASREDTLRYQTKVTRTSDGIEAFDLEASQPSWVDEAVVYEITPYSFVLDGTFNDITRKLPEIRKLGINTIWLQPIFPTENGWQGYDIIDYTTVNPEFGSEDDLRKLISRAKDLGMRVLLDVVYNHSSISHPYAKDRIRHGQSSHYYDFYQHQDDGKPYSSYYNLDENQFINYFWPDLVNLNYNNEEVARWILESAKYWVRNFDIDGYRLDAIWGVHSRNPEFVNRLRRELKSIKPDFLLLAEAKGSKPEVFELGYDVAYDWTADTTWVSQWSWEYEYSAKSPKTLFNHPEPQQRGALLFEALFENGGNMNRRLYHLENNDLPSFIQGHGLEKTQMAAALLFAMPGVPMLYNGQEIGFQGHPYATKAYFDRDRSIKEQDTLGLFEYYQRLIKIHKEHSALRGGYMDPISIEGNNALVGFRRWDEHQEIIVLVNLDEQSHLAQVPIEGPGHNLLNEDKTVVRDLLSEEITVLVNGDLKSPFVTVPMKGNSVRWLKFSKH